MALAQRGGSLLLLLLPLLLLRSLLLLLLLLLRSLLLLPGCFGLLGQTGGHLLHHGADTSCLLLLLLAPGRAVCLGAGGLVPLPLLLLLLLALLLALRRQFMQGADCLL